MPASKAQQRAVSKYMTANYDSFLVRIPKGRKATVEAVAQSQGESVNGLMNSLLRGAAGLTESEWKKGSAEDNGE